MKVSLAREPDPNLLVAIDISEKPELDVPHFSDFRVENGNVTLQVEFQKVSIDPTQHFIHLMNQSNRLTEGKTQFPYKFEGFENTEHGRKFRITSGELGDWRENVLQTESTGANMHLAQSITRAFQAACYMEKVNSEEIQRTRPVVQQPNWRFA